MTDSAEPKLAGTVSDRPGKRERLIVAALQLLHQQGIERTTLADIATLADVPLGNVYYYFKTKDDVIAAVIDAHRDQVNSTLARIDARHRTAKGRLKALVRELFAQRGVITEHGCPLGSLCSELGKRTGNTQAHAELMLIPIGWAKTQFRSLGSRDYAGQAVHLMAVYEGSALLANTLQDPDVLTDAARRLNLWIDAL